MLIPALLIACAVASQTDIAPQGSLQELPKGSTELVLSVTPLALEVGAGGRYPALSRTPSGQVDLCWFGQGSAAGRNTLFHSSWSETKWGAVESLAQGDNWLVNWADFAKYQENELGSAIACWQSFPEGKRGYGVQHQLRQKADSAWTAASSLHQDIDAVEHGFVSFAPLGKEHFFATWLQSTANGPPTQLRCTVLAADGTKSAEHVLDDLVCDCCSTDAVSLPNGEVVVAYRNRSEQELRDLRIVRGNPFEPESWSEPVAVDHEQWKAAGCPVNGPAMDNDGLFISMVYFTEGKFGNPQVKYLTSADGGVSFSKPILLASGKQCLGRVSVALLANGPAVVAWLRQNQENAENAEIAEWVACLIPRTGDPSTPVVIAQVSGTRADGFLQLAATATSVLAAWTSSAPQVVATARLTVQ